MQCYTIWYAYRVLICQIDIKGIWLQMKLDELFWAEVKIDAFKGGGGCKQKGND